MESFRLAVYNLNALPSEPLLNLALYGGLASLKLPACHPDAHSKNPDCPVCDAEGLGQLARDVPWSHHVNSTIVCMLTGKIMNEDNPPMAFPSGHVYSREVSSKRSVCGVLVLMKAPQALEEMSAKNGGFVTCPRTGKSCEYSSLRKVYIS